MTKADLRNELLKGKTLDSILRFRNGQDCMIFKADHFSTGDEILYIPDVDLNELPLDIDLSKDNSMMNEFRAGFLPMTAQEQVDLVLSYCYTGDDFIKECDGDVAQADFLFHYCDWQHPSSALPEIEDDEEGKDGRIEAES